MSVDDAVRKFQQEMQKLGMGVSIQVGDDDPVAVTTYCDKPGHGVSQGDVCVACAKEDA